MTPSASLMGPAGLNTVPGARMNPPGTVSAQISTFGPYAHAAISAQLAPAFSFTLRRSAELSSTLGSQESEGRRPWPALDFKLRLIEESRYAPELSVGADAAFGDKRTASEYLVAAKRVGAFDFTAGIGWGRMGESGEIANPLRLLGGHFSGKRDPVQGETGRGPLDWFSGHRAGLFGGIEYFPSFLDNASVKLDWTSWRWQAEKEAFPSFDSPAPWAVGVHWAALPWLDLGAGVAGGGVFMARARVTGDVGRWRALDLSARSDGNGIFGFGAQKSGKTESSRIEVNNESPPPYVFQKEGTQLEAGVALDPLESFPARAGRVLRDVLDHQEQEQKRAQRVGAGVQSLALAPVMYGLRGPCLTLPMRETRKALSSSSSFSSDAGGGVSLEELWRSAEFSSRCGATAMEARAFSASAPEEKRRDWIALPRMRLDARVSLAEPDAGVLNRSALVAQIRRPLLSRMGVLWGMSTRLMLSDTSDRLNGLRDWPKGGGNGLPGRFGAGAFAGLRVTAQDLFIGWTGTPVRDFHTMAAVGYVDEMYAGGGGEILWRPFGKTFALGAEGWGVMRRDPGTTMAQGILPGMGTSGFVKGWYEVPGTNLTASLRAGRYLAGDIGATIGLSASFRGGAKIEGWATATNARDRDAWGAKLPLAAGMRLTLPLGVPAGRLLPEGAEARLAFEPMGRKGGAAIENPLPLYDLTDAFSLRRIAQDWHDMKKNN